MELRYKILCRFLREKKSADTWKHFRTLPKIISISYGIKVEPYIRSPFLSDINCTEGVDQAED
jgi:hypothetical protein